MVGRLAEPRSVDTTRPRQRFEVDDGVAVEKEGYYEARLGKQVIKRDWVSIGRRPGGFIVRSSHTRLREATLEKSGELLCDLLWAPERLRLDFPEGNSILFVFARDEVVVQIGSTDAPEDSFQDKARYRAEAGPIFPLMHGMLYLPLIATRRLTALGETLVRFYTAPPGLCDIKRGDTTGWAEMNIKTVRGSDRLSLNADESGHLVNYTSLVQRLAVQFVERSNEC